MVQLTSPARVRLLLYFLMICSIWPMSESAHSRKKRVIIHLNNDNWKMVLQNHPLLLVLFHSSHCTASVKLKSELKDFKKLLDFENSRVDVAELDTYDYEPIMRNMGYPGLSEGKLGVPFVGFSVAGKPHLLKRTNPEMKHIRKFMRDVFFLRHGGVVESAGALESILNQSELTVVYYGQREHRHWASLSDWSMSRTRHRARLVLCRTDLGDDNKWGLVWNQAALFRRADRHTVGFEGEDYGHRQLEEWLYVHSHPAVGRLDAAGLQRLLWDGNPGAVLFVADVQQESRMLQDSQFEALAHQFRTRLLFFVCNVATDPRCLEFLGLCQLAPTDTPQIRVVHAPDFRAHPDFLLQYVAPSLSSTAVHQLVVEFLRGSAELWIKSEPTPPETSLSSSAVRKLTGRSISAALEVSNRVNTDLVVLFHCGEHDPASQSSLQSLSKVAGILAAYPVVFRTYDISANTWIGLSLPTSTAPTLRVYRQTEKPDFWQETKGTSLGVAEILSFIVDSASNDMELWELYEGKAAKILSASD